MDNSKNEIPKRKFKVWQIVVVALVVLWGIGSLTGGNSSDKKSTSSSSSSGSSATTTSSADIGSRKACETWRTNLANSRVETREQQIAGAQKVNEYASISTNPTIVSSARAMTEAFLIQDSEMYLSYGTIFGDTCKAMGA